MPKPALTRFLAASGAALAVVAVAGCDTPPGPAAGAPRQVTVVGEGTVEGTPDTLTIGVSISATAPDAIGAANLTSAKTTAVTDAVTGLGVDRKDVGTTTVTLQPQYGGPDGATIVGYQSANSIAVTVHTLDTGPQVLGAITTAGGDATRIDSVAYSIRDDSQFVKDARGRAFDDARNRAQQYAQLSGLGLGKVVSISENGSGGPPPPGPTPRYDARAAAVPLSPGQQTVGFSVTVVWELT